MKERPILFSGEMVRALLAGKKTQTRRVISGAMSWHGCLTGDCPHDKQTQCELDVLPLCRYGVVGDQLWVREAWTADLEWPTEKGLETRWWHETPKAFRGIKNCSYLYYRATPDQPHQTGYDNETGLTHWSPQPSTWKPKKADYEGVRWRPSVHMHRWMSRIQLEITNVRFQRLSSITEEDARAEGSESVAAFRALWDSINFKRGFGWHEFPVVWALTFKRIDS